MRTYRFAGFSIWAAVVVLGSQGCAGCGTSDTNFYTCDDPLPDRLDHNGHPDPCCLVDHCHDEDAGKAASRGDDGGDNAGDAADGGPLCAGACVAVPPLGWFGPALLWVGPNGTAPACPPQAPEPAYEGHADINVPDAKCTPCTCTASSGTCELDTVTANSTTCRPTAMPGTAFNPPSHWNGTCDTTNAIRAGSMCSGALCVQSITVAPLVITETNSPSDSMLKVSAPPSWKSAARACMGTNLAPSACNNASLTCAPAPEPGFATCVYHDGEEQCPAAYPAQHLVYSTYDDNRQCSFCWCNTTTKSQCTAILSVFTDGACSVEQAAISISSAGPVCFDVMPRGVALGSKTLTAVVYQPGVYEAVGGAVIGFATPSGASTFCCLSRH